MADHVLDKGYLAGTAIGIYRAVIQTADDTVKQCDTAAQLALGFCQEETSAGDATNGRVINVRVAGRTTAINGTAGALARNTKVTTDTSGRVVAAATGNAVIGVTRTAASAQGDWVQVDLSLGAAAP
jgi:hypothetical protein